MTSIYRMTDEDAQMMGRNCAVFYPGLKQLVDQYPALGRTFGWLLFVQKDFDDRAEMLSDAVRFFGDSSQAPKMLCDWYAQCCEGAGAAMALADEVRKMDAAATSEHVHEYMRTLYVKTEALQEQYLALFRFRPTMSVVVRRMQQFGFSPLDARGLALDQMLNVTTSVHGVIRAAVRMQLHPRFLTEEVVECLKPVGRIRAKVAAMQRELQNARETGIGEAGLAELALRLQGSAYAECINEYRALVRQMDFCASV